MNEIAPTFARAVSSAVDEQEVIGLAPGETSLDFLQRIYRSAKQPMSRRLRAAIEALPHEHPRLGAVAIGSMNGQDFASLLERAIKRSGKGHEVNQIEGRAVDLMSPPGRPMEDFEVRLRQLEK